MKYAILGDIHSNASALHAVLERAKHRQVERLLAVGDVVGYGAAPHACLASLFEHGVQVVRGNHDAACAGQVDLQRFNPSARAAIEWTRAQLSRSELDYLGKLPWLLDLEHCSVAHATYAHPENFEYMYTPTSADSSLDLLTSSVCFVGHTHVPVTMLRPREDPTLTAYSMESELDLEECVRAVVNVGSVGQPRDEDPRAAIGFYDSDLGRVWIERVEYDVAREADRIRKAGLPASLADRLSIGV